MAEMYTTKQVVEELRKRNIADTARAVGVHPQTLYKVVRGEIQSMSAETYLKLVALIWPAVKP